MCSVAWVPNLKLISHCFLDPVTMKDQCQMNETRDQTIFGFKIKPKFNLQVVLEPKSIQNPKSDWGAILEAKIFSRQFQNRFTGGLAAGSSFSGAVFFWTSSTHNGGMLSKAHLASRILSQDVQVFGSENVAQSVHNWSQNGHQ